MFGWSEEIKNKTRECAGDGAMLKNLKGEFGFYASDKNGIKILGVKEGEYFPIPSKEVIATFSDIEKMIDSGWVID